MRVDEGEDAAADEGEDAGDGEGEGVDVDVDGGDDVAVAADRDVDAGDGVGEAEIEGVDVDVGVGDGGGVDDGVGANRCTIVRPPLDTATGAESCQESPIKNPTPNASGAMINTSRNSFSDLGSEII